MTLKRLIIGVLVLGLIGFFLLQGLIFSVHNADDSGTEVQTLIILGAKLKTDKPMPALNNRLETALTYLERYPKTMVICSGGQGTDELISEALAMKNWLLERGIDEKRIILEDESKNTFENLYYSQELLAEKGLSNQVAIATSGYHLFRANMLANRIGLDPILLSAKTPGSILLQVYVREALAIVKSFFLDR